MAYIEFRNVHKSFGNNEVLKGINLSIDEGEFVTLLGPSGCGKSTLLRCFSGLETVTEGEIYLDGTNITDFTPKQRKIGMVFQQYSAIIMEPKVLLLDEPLSAIDALLRRNLQVEIRKIQQNLKMTTIFVTHDQEEAMVMSDTIHLFNVGQIEQSGSPADIYTHPQTKFAANFIGHYNILSNPDLKKLCGLSSDCDFVAIRPEAVLISPEPLNDAVHFQGKITGVMLRGTTISYTIDCDGIELRADTLFETNRQRNMGEMLQLQILKEDILHLH